MYKLYKLCVFNCFRMDYLLSMEQQAAIATYWKTRISFLCSAIIKLYDVRSSTVLGYNSLFSAVVVFSFCRLSSFAFAERNRYCLVGKENKSDNFFFGVSTHQLLFLWIYWISSVRCTLLISAFACILLVWSVYFCWIRPFGLIKVHRKRKREEEGKRDLKEPICFGSRLNLLEFVVILVASC